MQLRPSFLCPGIIFLLCLCVSPSSASIEMQTGALSGTLLSNLHNNASGQIPVSISGAFGSFDMTFSFSASPDAFFVANSNRLGITSVHDEGGFNNINQGASTLNPGEQLSLTVSISNLVPALGQSISSIDFGITKIDLKRGSGNGPGDGNSELIPIRFQWDSSAASSTSAYTTGFSTVLSDAVFDGLNAFDLLSGDYLATFETEKEPGETRASNGLRIVTGEGAGSALEPWDNFHYSLKITSEAEQLATIPEPASFVVFTGLGISCIGLTWLRRR